MDLITWSGNWTSWSAILVWNHTSDFKSNSRYAFVRFWNHAYDFRPNCTHSVQLPLLIGNCLRFSILFVLFIEKAIIPNRRLFSTLKSGPSRILDWRCRPEHKSVTRCAPLINLVIYLPIWKKESTAYTCQKRKLYPLVGQYSLRCWLVFEEELCILVWGFKY